MDREKYDYGMIGLGTMGRNLVYNMCDHGFTVVGYDKDVSKVESLEKEAVGKKLLGARNLPEFIDSLKQPRVILMLVPAGPIVDAVISELKPILSKDDLMIDCGNSHYKDTDKRNEELAKDGLHFMGVGISGGESGARFGPSIMPGGPREVYEGVAPMFKAVSAKVKAEPCVAWLGPGSAGHYVKMVHNGIEYALMQLIAETYQFLKEVAGMNNDQLHVTYSKWNEGHLQSFLIEITADIFNQPDDLTANRLIDMILDGAQQKGTGKWTSQDAMEIYVPIPSIDIAVSMRELSSLKEERVLAQKKLMGPAEVFGGNRQELLDWLQDSVYFTMIVIYAQGMSLLQKASTVYKYNLVLADVARIWRGGCIIRASLLEDILTAFTRQPDLQNLLVSEVFFQRLIKLQEGLRKIIRIGVKMGISLPVMMTSLCYYDEYRRSWLPANLIQAQRDFFGSHTYQRIDRKGVFHTHWNQKQN